MDGCVEPAAMANTELDGGKEGAAVGAQDWPESKLSGKAVEDLTDGDRARRRRFSAVQDGVVFADGEKGAGQDARASGGGELVVDDVLCDERDAS